MKKTICVIIAAIVLLAAYMVFKPKTVIYPHIYGDSIPGAVSTSYGMPLNFKIFREYRREKVNVNVYSGNKEDTTEGKEPLAVFDKAFEKKGNTIETVRFIWDTPAEPGDYFVEFYTSYFNGETWLDSPNRKYENFKVISPCTKHTFVENANSVYGTPGVKSDCNNHGTAYRTCAVCSVEEPYELPYMHSYSGGVTIQAASCRDMGYKTYECVRCGEIKVEVIMSDSTKHRIGAVVKIEPTATRPGSVWFECSRCNYVEPYKAEIPALYMDINPALYYERPVAWAYDNEYFGKVKGYTFDPENECDRAVAVSLMYLANGVGVLAEDVNPFSDVKIGDYYMDAAKWAYKFRIIDGTQFRPFDPCTRAEIVEYLWRMEGCPEVAYRHNFTDVSNQDSYSKAVAWAVSEGIASGMTETEFEPHRYCNEAQVLTFIYRVLNEEEPEDDGGFPMG